MTFLQDAERQEQLLAEFLLTAAHEGLRRKCTDGIVGDLGPPERSLPSPDGQNHMAFDTEFLFDGLERLFPSGLLFTADFGDVGETLSRKITTRAVELRLLFLATGLFRSRPRGLTLAEIRWLQVGQLPIELDALHGHIECLGCNTLGCRIELQG